MAAHLFRYSASTSKIKKDHCRPAFYLRTEVQSFSAVPGNSCRFVTVDETNNARVSIPDSDNSNDLFRCYSNQPELRSLPENIMSMMDKEGLRWLNISGSPKLWVLGDLSGDKLEKTLFKSLELEKKPSNGPETTSYLAELKQLISLKYDKQTWSSDNILRQVEFIRDKETINLLPKSVAKMARKLSGLISALPNDPVYLEKARVIPLFVFAERVLAHLDLLNSRWKIIDSIVNKINKNTEVLELTDQYPQHLPVYVRLLKSVSKIILNSDNLHLMKDLAHLDKLSHMVVVKAAKLRDLNGFLEDGNVTELVIDGAESFSSFNGIYKLAAVKEITIYGAESEIDMTELANIEHLNMIHIVHYGRVTEIGAIAVANRRKLEEMKASRSELSSSLSGDCFVLDETNELLRVTDGVSEPLYVIATSSTGSSGELTGSDHSSNSELLAQRVVGFIEVADAIGPEGREGPIMIEENGAPILPRMVE